MGNHWRSRFMYQEEYEKKHGTDSRAVCCSDKKTIDFNILDTDLETVVHELSHAWMAELSFVEVQLDDTQKEEWCCEFVAKHGQKVFKQARAIFKILAPLKKRKTDANKGKDKKIIKSSRKRR
jgi:hypothetical protein